MWVSVLGFVVSFWQHLHNDIMGGVILSQPDVKKDPAKNDSKMIKTHIILESS